MKDILDNIRKPSYNTQISLKIRNALAMLILGIILGIFSKWLDNLSINDAIWWQHILGLLDLGNVFSDFGIWILFAIIISVFSKTPFQASVNVFFFFLGMTTSYHLYTIIFSGFNPQNYMFIWYTITLITPILSFVCWYARGEGIISVIICTIILTIMLLLNFSIGIWYFDFRRIIDTIIFLASLVVLHINYKRSLSCLAGAIILVFLIRIFI